MCACVGFKLISVSRPCARAHRRLALLVRRSDPALPPLVYEPHPPSNSNPNPCSDAELGADRGGGNARGGKAAEATRRRALREFDAIAGNQQSDANYCDRRLFFERPRHVRCFAALSRFFAADVARLHGNLSVAGGGAARGG